MEGRPTWRAAPSRGAEDAAEVEAFEKEFGATIRDELLPLLGKAHALVSADFSSWS